MYYWDTSLGTTILVGGRYPYQIHYVMKPSQAITSETLHTRLVPDGVTKGTHHPAVWEGGKAKLGKSQLVCQGEIVPSPTYTPSEKLTPHLNDVLNQAHHIAMAQLIRLREASETRILDSDEVGQFAKLADAVAKLDRTSREREKMKDPAGLTLEELLALADKAKEVLSGGTER